MSGSGIFDRQLMLQFQKRALAKPVADADFLLSRAVEDVLDRLSAVEKHFGTGVALMGYTDALAQGLAHSEKVDKVIRIEQGDFYFQDSGAAFEKGVVEPNEILPLEPQSADLIISLMSLHLVNDLPGMLIQISRALRPDGLFLAAFPGTGTLGELRESLMQAEIELTGGAAARIAPFADIRDAGALLQRAGFALPVTDVDTVTVRYNSMFDLLKDIRAMGMQNILLDRSRKPLTRSVFMRAAQIYTDRFSDLDGRIRASFSTLWMSGWKPHESQQKPLKPGSAKASLADALQQFQTKPDEE
ncbi:methyltransferase domain-containing protein [Paenochrobactrum sp. BZR 588]|uniref:methyltransferase domain-containing protein n=1 Tax=unclassified Paenochrobactrum TaxID=2639760 RepID=UPI00385337FE